MKTKLMMMAVAAFVAGCVNYQKMQDEEAAL